MSNTDTVSVSFIRTTAVDPDPRVDRAIEWIDEIADTVKVLAWDREGNSPALEQRDKVTILRNRFPGCYGRGLHNLLGFAAFNCSVLWQLFREPPRIVHACDLDTVLPAILISKFKNIRIVYDIFDYYSESRNVGFLKPILKWVDNWAMRQVDSIIIAHESRMIQLGENGKKLRQKISVIYNTPADVPGEALTSPSAYFSYVGVLQSDRGLPEIIQAARDMQEVKLLIAGFGPLSPNLLACRNDNIDFWGRVNYEQAMAIQGGSLAIFALYDPEIPNNRLAAPNKLYEAMYLGKPIITSAGTILAEFVAKEEIGFVIPYGNAIMLRQVMEFCLENRDELAVMGRRARRLYDAKYSGTAMKSKLQTIYRQLLN